MKIEIDKSHVDWLEAEVKRLNERLKEFTDGQYELYKDRQLSKSLELSELLFKSYCHAIFNKLGFQNSTVQLNLSDLRHKLSKSWFDYGMRDKIKVTIGATITNNFREAILKVGIDEKAIEKIKEDNSEWDLITYKETENQ